MSDRNQVQISQQILDKARGCEMEVVALFLAQSNEPQPPHKDLGYATQSEAFTAIASKFQTNPHTVKLTRDAFDYHTDSGRIGWRDDLRPALAKVYKRFGDLSRQELLGVCQSILKLNQTEAPMSQGPEFEELFARVVAANSETSTSPAYHGQIVEFSNTGRRSDGWFSLTVEQIRDCLQDMIDNQQVFDSLNKSHNGYNEPAWRGAFDRNLTNRVARTMGGVQTLPMFELLAKIIHFSNDDSPRRYKSIETERLKLERALGVLSNHLLGSSPAGSKAPSAGSRILGGDNILFYGAPGTGKSYSVWEMVDHDNDHHFTTVFHPDMQNSDFAGTLKPGIDGDNQVTYAFRPGPFARAVACAWAHPHKKVYLVIEELNRAVAAAVFGELFQLLDRQPDGSSSYEVDFPSPEFEKWFRDAANSDAERLALPSNLWILATMNSADQGVYPLDTAFRRRWRQHYLAIDYKKAPKAEIQYAAPNGGESKTDWRKFVRALNRFLVSELQIDEDRLIGPRFLNDQDLEDGKLPGKLLIYLWDDLLRHHQDKVLFDNSIRTYGELDRRMSEGKQMFSNDFLSLLETEGSDSNALDADSDPSQ